MKNKKDLISKIKMIGAGSILALGLTSCGGGGGGSSNQSVSVNLGFKYLPESSLYIINPQTGIKEIRDVNNNVTLVTTATDSNGYTLSTNGITTSIYICDSNSIDYSSCDTIEENSINVERQIDLTNLGGKYINGEIFDSKTGEYVMISLPVDKNDAPVLNNYTIDNNSSFDGFVGDTFSVPSLEDYTDSENDNISLDIEGNAVDYLDNNTLKFTKSGLYEINITPKDKFGAKGEDFVNYYNINDGSSTSCVHNGLEVFIDNELSTYPSSSVDWNKSCEDVSIKSMCVYDVKSNTATLVPTPGSSLTCYTKAPLDCTLPDGSIISHGISKCLDSKIETCINGNLKEIDPNKYCTEDDSSSSIGIGTGNTDDDNLII